MSGHPDAHGEGPRTRLHIALQVHAPPQAMLVLQATNFWRLAETLAPSAPLAPVVRLPCSTAFQL